MTVAHASTSATPAVIIEIAVSLRGSDRRPSSPLGLSSTGLVLDDGGERKKARAETDAEPIGCPGVDDETHLVVFLKQLDHAACSRGKTVQVADGEYRESTQRIDH